MGIQLLFWYPFMTTTIGIIFPEYALSLIYFQFHTRHWRSNEKLELYEKESMCSRGNSYQLPIPSCLPDFELQAESKLREGSRSDDLLTVQCRGLLNRNTYLPRYRNPTYDNSV